MILTLTLQIVSECIHPLFWGSSLEFLPLQPQWRKPLSKVNPSLKCVEQVLHFCNGKAFSNLVRKVLLRKQLSPKSLLHFLFVQKLLVRVVWLLHSLHPFTCEFFQLTDWIAWLFTCLYFLSPDLPLLRNQVEGKQTWAPDGKGSTVLQVVFAWAVTSFLLFQILLRPWLTLVLLPPKYHLQKFCWTFSNFFFTFLWTWTLVNDYILPGWVSKGACTSET